MDATTSRRAILGAIGATAALGGAGIAATVSAVNRAEWERAVTALDAVNAAWRAHPSMTTASSAPNYGELEAEEDVLMSRSVDALRRVMSTTPPDLPAAIEKAAIFLREYGDPSYGAGNFMTAIVADLQRLSKEAGHVR